jgi:hypothetical protein
VEFSASYSHLIVLVCVLMQGFDPDIFSDDVEAMDGLLCGVCRLVVKDPVVIPCGHSFCRYCMETWMESGGDSCPCCRTSVERGQLHPSHALRALIERETVQCPYCTTTESNTDDPTITVPAPQPPPTLAEAPPCPPCPEEALGPPAHVVEDLKVHVDVVGPVLVQISDLLGQLPTGEKSRQIQELMAKVMALEQREPLHSTVSNPVLGSLRVARESRRHIKRKLSGGKESKVTVSTTAESVAGRDVVSVPTTDQDVDDTTIYAEAHALPQPRMPAAAAVAVAPTTVESPEAHASPATSRTADQPVRSLSNEAVGWEGPLHDWFAHMETVHRLTVI